MSSSIYRLLSLINSPAPEAVEHFTETVSSDTGAPSSPVSLYIPPKYGFIRGPFHYGDRPPASRRTLKNLNYDEITRLAVQLPRKRRGTEIKEFQRIREAWLAAGGSMREGIDIVDALMRGAEVVSGGNVIHSPIWGNIDPSRFNRGISAYLGTRAEAMLIRDMAIFTDSFGLNARRFEFELRIRPLISPSQHKPSPKTFLHYFVLCGDLRDWRRIVYFALLFESEGFLEKYRGTIGYDQFALAYFQGDPSRAFGVAHLLLSEDEFKALGWGDYRKIVNINEQDFVRGVLRQGAASGKYVGVSGYDQFALDFFEGYLAKASEAAESLLSPAEFAALEWGPERYHNVNKDIAIRNAIYAGLYRGVQGYDKFALFFFKGNSWTAWNVASSLFSRDEFASLGWGHKKYTNVNNQEEILQALLSKKYAGREGRKLFTMDLKNRLPYMGLYDKFRISYDVALSLLDSVEFAELGWKEKDQLTKAEWKYLTSGHFTNSPPAPVPNLQPGMMGISAAQIGPQTVLYNPVSAMTTLPLTNIVPMMTGV